MTGPVLDTGERARIMPSAMRSVVFGFVFTRSNGAGERAM
jgi:hypothetical protein